MNQVNADLGEILWMSGDESQSVIKLSNIYLLKDKKGTLVNMGKSPESIKDCLNQFGRTDILEDLKQRGFLS
ncbi:MAG: hypothetical protein H6Q70_3470 [Firmicutes bacterium]|nr:hypothetical protein [Bacillota bacterium]